ncbi:MAG: hypothetical protein J0M08_05060 [Bacteroidetes bacterium]|nr:hypothetical protein [Bacteroidota bacterium]
MPDKKLEQLNAAVNVKTTDLLYGTQFDPNTNSHKSRKFSVDQVRGNTPFVNVIDMGAKGDGTTDDTATFQAAIDIGKPVYVPQSIAFYKINSPLQVKRDDVFIFGDGIYLSDIRYYGASGSLLFNPNYQTIGYQRFHIEKLRLWSGLGGSTNPIVDLRCLKYSTVRNCWIHGNNSNWVGTCVRMAGHNNGGNNWIDGTYNLIEGNHFQLCGIGVDIQEDANSSITMRNRSQPSALPGVGYRYGSSFLGYPNHITSIDDSCEFPGKVKTGFEINSNATNIMIIHPRCESMLYGIRSTDSSARATVIGGYYSGSEITNGLPNNVVNDGGVLNDYSGSHNSATCKLQVSFDGTGTGPALAIDRGMNVSGITKNATGDYTISFTGTLPSNPIINGLAQNAGLQIKSTTTSSITLLTVNSAGTPTDSSRITIQVN